MRELTLCELTPRELTLAGPPSAEAVKRPPASFGAGAFTRDGARIGFGTWASAAISEGCLHGGDLGGSHQAGPIQISPIQADAVLATSVRPSAAQSYTQHFNQMTRLHPVTPGGVGPHPAREPDPV